MTRITTALTLGLLALLALGASTPSGCGGGTSTMSSALGAGGSGSSDPAGSRRFHARLIGFRETPANSTTGHGTFQATLSDDGKTATFELTYADLQGVPEGGAPTAAHVHLGQRGVAGGVAVALCGAGTRPACPVQPATVTGTIAAADVVGPTAQGLAAGDLAKLLEAARAGVTYVNVHSAGFPAGEIRGQIRPGEGEDAD